VAGTSLATPLVAAMVIDAQQGQATSLGFINPLLYSPAGSSAFHDILPFDASTPPQDAVAFDPKGLYDPKALLGLQDAQGLGNTTQVTAPGYDTMTGLGTPNGSAFIAALRGGR
jgi:subtilase family serine protease